MFQVQLDPVKQNNGLCFYIFDIFRTKFGFCLDVLRKSGKETKFGHSERIFSLIIGENLLVLSKIMRYCLISFKFSSWVFHYFFLKCHFLSQSF